MAEAEATGEHTSQLNRRNNFLFSDLTALDAP